MADEPQKWSWTDKLPLILAGLGLLVAGIFFLFRKCWRIHSASPAALLSYAGRGA
jgi:hypothetical protein